MEEDTSAHTAHTENDNNLSKLFIGVMAISLCLIFAGTVFGLIIMFFAP